MPDFETTIPVATESSLFRALSAVGSACYTPGFRQQIWSLVWFIMATPAGQWSLGEKQVTWETVDGTKSARITG